MSWMDKNMNAIVGRGLRADAGRVGRLPREMLEETIGACELDELELDFGQPWPEGKMVKMNRDRKRRTCRPRRERSSREP